jgi:hypothetical protein
VPDVNWRFMTSYSERVFAIAARSTSARGISWKGRKFASSEGISGPFWMTMRCFNEGRIDDGEDSDISGTICRIKGI